MQVRYRQKSGFWSNSWLSKIAGRAKCQKHLPTTKLSVWHSRSRTTGYRSITWRSNYEVTKTVTDDHAVDRSRRLTSECLFVTACSMDEYAEEKRTEKHLIVRSGISEAETTNNKRLRSTFCIEAIQTRAASLRQQSFLYALPACDGRTDGRTRPYRVIAHLRSNTLAKCDKNRWRTSINTLTKHLPLKRCKTW